MQINQYEITSSGLPFIIAEIGTAHQGDIHKAKELIDAATESGAHCAKFQIVFAEEILHYRTGVVQLPGGSINLYGIFKNLERDQFFYQELKLYAEKKGLVFLASAFGEKSIQILENLHVDAIKIASPESNYHALLQRAAQSGLPVILSTGITKLSDIEESLNFLLEDVILLHCVTSYPSPEEDYNLKLIKTLNAVFGKPVGVSDHSKDPSIIPLVALSQGAVMIEKHFTLSSSDEGLDDSIALTPDNFKKMTDDLKTGSALTQTELINYLNHEYGKKRIDLVLGDGVKKLAASEEMNYLTTRRSIHAWEALPVGTTLSIDNLAILRTEKNLKAGLHPRYWGNVIGKKTTRFVEAGEGLTWDDLLTR